MLLFWLILLHLFVREHIEGVENMSNTEAEEFAKRTDFVPENTYQKSLKILVSKLPANVQPQSNDLESLIGAVKAFRAGHGGEEGA